MIAQPIVRDTLAKIREYEKDREYSFQVRERMIESAARFYQVNARQLKRAIDKLDKK